jgi:hypothetical protein
LSRIEARGGKHFYMQENTLQGIVPELCTDVKGAFNGRKVDLQTGGIGLYRLLMLIKCAKY